MKINNTRTDVVLIGHFLKSNIAVEITEENRTALAKVTWLSTKYNGRAYNSLVTYFTKGSESMRFLREGCMYIDKESVNIRIYKLKEDSPCCFNC